MSILLYVFFGIGALFNGLGAFALMRFPDVYTRLHGTTKCTTFGSVFTTLGVVIYAFARGGAANQTLAIHALIALAALLITNPTGSHAIARAARRSGVKPWGAVVDKWEDR
jgi:multicomponent Na+:H+ antiporter subunit G